MIRKEQPTSMEKPTNDLRAAMKRKAPEENTSTALTRESPASVNPDAAALTTKRGIPLFIHSLAALLLLAKKHP